MLFCFYFLFFYFDLKNDANFAYDCTTLVSHNKQTLKLNLQVLISSFNNCAYQ